MTEEITQSHPLLYKAIVQATELSGFSMASDVKTCSLLRTLAGSKPASELLELGTGTGLSTSWILDGMDADSTLISIDNDPVCLDIAGRILGNDKRLSLVNTDGGEWINANLKLRFDYIFADTWHGKYLLLDETLSMLKKGGLYLIDDMLPQPNWPDGHQEKAADLLNYLDSRSDLFVTRQAWATGIVMAVKK